MRILVINGPNLNLLGTRDPSVYGTETLADLEKHWRSRAAASGATIDAFQSNHEGAIIDAIGEGSTRYDVLVLNAGALTHYSYAIADAVASVGLPTVEVHISNIYEREAWRRVSVLTDVCLLTIVGRGAEGYLNAIDHLVASTAHPPLTVKYGSDADAILDLRMPSGDGPHRVAMLIHGGFWREPWKRDLMDPMAVALAAQGWATVNIEYSRGSGSYAATTRGVQDAVRWIRDNSSDHNLDPDRVVAVGHSAGGYLALTLAHGEIAVSGVVALGSVTNLSATSAAHPEDDPVAAFLGASRDEAPRLWEQAEIVGDPSVPVHFVHGTHDDVVAPSQIEAYAQSRDGSISATMITDGDHMIVIDPLSAAWPDVLAAIESVS